VEPTQLDPLHRGSAEDGDRIQSPKHILNKTGEWIMSRNIIVNNMF
jgi:hypothetical protein